MLFLKHCNISELTIAEKLGISISKTELHEIIEKK